MPSELIFKLSILRKHIHVQCHLSVFYKLKPLNNNVPFRSCYTQRSDRLQNCIIHRASQPSFYEVPVLRESMKTRKAALPKDMSTLKHYTTIR